MYRDKVIAVVVPAFNEEVLIQETLLGIPDFVDRVYVINDGSRDCTGERIREVASKDGRIVLINHETNKGVGAAIVTGYARSFKDGMDITAVMAGDNQMDPLELPKLLDPVVDGEADYSKGNRLRSRDTAKGMSSWRYFGNNLLTYMTRIAAGSARISDPQNGYTAISNHVFKTMRPESIFTWYGYCNDHAGQAVRLWFCHQGCGNPGAVWPGALRDIVPEVHLQDLAPAVQRAGVAAEPSAA